MQKRVAETYKVVPLLKTGTEDSHWDEYVKQGRIKGLKKDRTVALSLLHNSYIYI